MPKAFAIRAVRDRFDIAALGDSFTDAMTMAGEASWPARLEGVLGVPVQNYGTAGFGPQQELLVLKDIVAPHRPRTVVLAFFAGNDIFDAEEFDAFQRSGGTIKRAPTGMAHQGRRQPRRLVVRRQRADAPRAARSRRHQGTVARGGTRAGTPADRGAARGRAARSIAAGSTCR